MSAAVLEAGVCAEQVRVDEIVDVAVDASQDGWFGRALDERVDRTGGLEVVSVADVTTNEYDAGGLESGEVQLGAGSVEIVERHDIPVAASREVHGDVASDETGAAGDEDPHRTRILRFRPLPFPRDGKVECHPAAA